MLKVMQADMGKITGTVIQNKVEIIMFEMHVIKTDHTATYD